MMFVMRMIEHTANESDVDFDILALLLQDDAFHVAVLMNRRHMPPVIALEGRKTETHCQKYEQAGDKAVPFHDREQRS